MDTQAPPEQHPVTLRFRSGRLEAAFRQAYAQKSVGTVRVALAVGVVLYGLLFGAMDSWNAEESLAAIWAIRSGVCAAALGVLAFSFTEHFRRWMQPVLAVLVVLAGLGLVAMLALSTTGDYYDGPVLLILPAFVVLRLRFWPATLATGIVVAAYFAVLFGVKNPPLDALLNSAIFVTAALVIGMVAGYALEAYARRDFWQARLIDQERRENARLLRARTRFFSNVSHELRTPLTLIAGPLSDVLTDESALPDALRRPLQTAHAQAGRLRRLVDELLDLAKLDAGRLPLRAQEIDLVPLLERLRESFVHRAGRLSLRLEMETDAAACPVFADPPKLETILVNLLGNALRFTPEGGRVRLVLLSEEEHAEIRVEDTGPGIAEEEQARLFERFQQASGSEGGTGIGLALVKELAELHHGTVSVESAEDEGTRFTLRLPKGRAQLAPDELAPADASRTTLGPSEAPSPEEAAPDSADAALDAAAAVVLVVEDHAEMRRYIADGLRAAYQIVEAADGEAGLLKARAVVPDCIVSDVMMPGMDGFDFCRAVKTDPALDHIPVILLTARASTESAVEGLHTGADDYVRKPFNARELEARVRGLIESRRRLRARFSEQALVRTGPPEAPSAEKKLPDAAQPTPVDVKSAEEVFIEEARAVVERHLDDEAFSVEAFAEELSLSERQLQRKLRAIADQTPSAFIRLMRLRRGAQLLAQGYGTVSEIAYAVGFSTPSYFTKCFGEVFEQTPTEYAALAEKRGKEEARKR